jgi:YfiH family protein
VTAGLIRPRWPAPAPVAAVTTTRLGGRSGAPFDTLNLGDHVGDDAAAVAANRQLLLDACPGLAAVSWLRQVHGTTVVAAAAGGAAEADAQFTRQAGLACAVMTADCLPVLFCDRAGTQVAAAHAGWRGLCAGVLERTAACFAAPDTVLAWLGPAIGPRHFEVGAEVREQFVDSADASQRQATAQCFSAGVRPGRFMADLYQLARLRLRAAGIDAVYGGDYCTFEERERFFSYRREAITGRMASLIYLVAAAPDA